MHHISAPVKCGAGHDTGGTESTGISAETTTNSRATRFRYRANGYFSFFGRSKNGRGTSGVGDAERKTMYRRITWDIRCERKPAVNARGARRRKVGVGRIGGFVRENCFWPKRRRRIRGPFKRTVFTNVTRPCKLDGCRVSRSTGRDGDTRCPRTRFNNTSLARLVFSFRVRHKIRLQP